jgi:hypothetical protein
MAHWTTAERFEKEERGSLFIPFRVLWLNGLRV